MFTSKQSFFRDSRALPSSSGSLKDNVSMVLKRMVRWVLNIRLRSEFLGRCFRFFLQEEIAHSNFDLIDGRTRSVSLELKIQA